jgi:urease accessory protein
MASDDPPRRKRFKRKPDWRAPDTGRGPDTGEGPEVGHGPEVGERPDTGRGPEVGPRPDFGESPDTGKGPDTSRIEEEDRAGGGAAMGSVGGSLATVLMLADARFPAGGHAHSGGLEGAVTAGMVTDVGSLELFLRGRLVTAGVVAAGLAAAACARAADGASGANEASGADEGPGAGASSGSDGDFGAGAPGGAGEARGVWEVWRWLDAEADARTPSPAQREASRRQGRALLRAARAAWPSAALDALGRAPHHALVLGAAAAAAGCTPGEAGLIAAYLTVTGPASAAVRLLALDPIQVSAAIARLAGAIEGAAARGADAIAADDLPYPSAPALDLYAEAHAREEVRLFAS